MKPTDQLGIADMEQCHVWQYVEIDSNDETWVRQVKRTPVSNLSGKEVATTVCLANGQHVWALVGNIGTKKPRFTEHFIAISVLHNGKWFNLARYHDFDFEERGPNKLALFLGLSVDDVFPISYDLRQYVKGESEALTGVIRKEPKEKLSRADIIAMAVP